MKRIDVAIIDSGVHPGHIHVGGVAGGIGFELDENGSVRATLDFEDRIGHGTAIAGVIREKNPDAALFALKIFHDRLRAPFALLRAAMEFAIREKMDIIHLSLGTREESRREELETLCRKAREGGAVVVSSAGSREDRVYPSVLDGVVGVCCEENCREDELIRHPEGPIQFGAHGRPRPLPGLDQKRNFHGGSFAAARVTAQIAREMALGKFSIREP